LIFLGKARDEGDSQLLVDHKGQDTHLGGTALVELDGTLGELGLLVEGVPSEIEGIVTEVTDEFSSDDVLHDGKLKEANQGNDLGNSSTRDGVEGGETIRDVSEGKSGVVNVSGKTDSGLGDKVSDNSKHTDASVLDLDVTETIELLLVTISDDSERIEESKRSLGTKRILEGSQRFRTPEVLEYTESHLKRIVVEEFDVLKDIKKEYRAVYLELFPRI
jgi:hypothetical protein